jgi:hypothetical protein
MRNTSLRATGTDRGASRMWGTTLYATVAVTALD